MRHLQQRLDVGHRERREAGVDPMLNNETVTHDSASQDALARWATLRMLIAQLGHPTGRRRAIPPERYKSFYASRELPPVAQVWIGRHNGRGGWPTDYTHREIFVSFAGRPEPTTPNAYVAAFSIGYAAFVYWGNEYRGLYITSLRGLAPYLVPLWPIHPGSVRWPPNGLIGENGLKAVIDSFPIT